MTQYMDIYDLNGPLQLSLFFLLSGFSLALGYGRLVPHSLYKIYHCCSDPRRILTGIGVWQNFTQTEFLGMAQLTGVILFSMKFHIADLPLSTISPTYLPSTAGQVQGTTPSPGTAPSRPSPSPTCGTCLSWRTLMPLHRGQLAHLLPSILSFPACWPGYK